MGWKLFSEDAQHIAFWVTLGVAIVGATVAGVYWNWWAYIWNVPPPIRWLMGLEAAVAVFVLFYAVALIGNKYFNWPRHHPLFPVHFSTQSRVASPPTIHAKNEPIILDWFEFYPSRETFSVHRPIKQHIKTADAVWAMWNAGTSAWASDVVQTGRIKRLLLPDPYLASVINPLAQIARRDAHDISSDVHGLTKQALEAGVKVRWFRFAAGNTLTIGDPEKGHSGWIQLETLIAFVGANERPGFRISQTEFPELFSELIRTYDNVWRSDELSRPATLEDA